MIIDFIVSMKLFPSETRQVFSRKTANSRLFKDDNVSFIQKSFMQQTNLPKKKANKPEISERKCF